MDIVKTTTTVKRLAERGLTTVEYAIGLLAAAAAALVLLRIFNDNQFFKMLFDWVVNIFNNISTGNGGGSIFDIFGKMFGF
ncbi:DUF4244 domain-containing protein [uncultured Tessaracoccus sp.]|uniref:DUF4244 domain-containing protein n=1 Tax=uncultured Tessaracoccus sp. TaxID=905023 RepID=UPI002639E3FA|nr:DUF4244 domain-containing protein [uncultured Tessaracoccus sp.]